MGRLSQFSPARASAGARVVSTRSGRSFYNARPAFGGTHTGPRFAVGDDDAAVPNCRRRGDESEGHFTGFFPRVPFRVVSEDIAGKSAVLRRWRSNLQAVIASEQQQRIAENRRGG